MSTVLWKVDRVSLTADAKRNGATRTYYALHVEGVYSEHANPRNVGERFAWSVPAAALYDAQYDYSGAVLDRIAALDACFPSRGLPVESCPTCSRPAHPSESTETGEHPACYTARTGELTVDAEGDERPDRPCDPDCSRRLHPFCACDCSRTEGTVTP